MKRRKDTTALATFGAGCFWDSEAAFRRLKGVIATRVGFMGGGTSCPTYEEVCSGTTGHVEVVQVVYDPSRITFDILLDAFWNVLDTPSSAPCYGTVSQYRPVIFFHSKEQEAAARASREKRQRSGDSAYRGIPEISPASEFYEAEEHHQQFYEKCGRGYATVPRYYE